jgi:hypothetical protein
MLLRAFKHDCESRRVDQLGRVELAARPAARVGYEMKLQAGS